MSFDIDDISGFAELKPLTLSEEHLKIYRLEIKTGLMKVMQLSDFIFLSIN